METETLSDQILRENASVFEAMVNHRFVEDVKRNGLSNETFERYLVYEGAFVDTAISIFAYGVAKAETVEQKRWLVGVLDALANQQIAYFEKTFALRGINPSAFDLQLPEVEAFRTGMLEIAREGTFLDIVAAMFAAEWMYWTWSKQAKASAISDPLLREWVDMHTHEDFAAQAMWLRDQLDGAGETLTAKERARLSSVFARAQELEIEFHEAPYR
ncbi:TenA family protein [Sinorhizobium numidicum]|uniref:Aminopyrimidine aminohydrolase n=1 Tax=Sinorhizobium numidicum TaxID=680248 RepID=A0ABY8CUW6_9HYPH|nr:TenA family protein [Sinorhizobium numidicum]WEX75044.1 TenA family protein [Sinorhizobium numidicum]WEX81038.1 TenA family protein [Sinorhizobium numidicum]